MSFLQYLTLNNTLRFIYEDYHYTPLLSDPDSLAGRPSADWQRIPADPNTMIDYISLYRRRRLRQDDKRPFIVIRPPHNPPLDTQLVVRLQGIVKDVDLSVLGNWDKTTQRLSCARAVRYITIGADTSQPDLWRETIKGVNMIREAVRHHLFETGEFNRQAPFGIIPETDAAVLKFEQRVFSKDGEVRHAPEYLGVNDKLNQMATRWHLTEQFTSLRAVDGGPNVAPINAGLIQENDFVDIAAVINITVNPPRRFFLSFEALRVVQLRPAPQPTEEDSDDDIGTGPVIDYVLPVPQFVPTGHTAETTGAFDLSMHAVNGSEV